MSSLTAIFGNSEGKTQDSDKLMDLYWNRAELKKEFAGMRKEQYRLQDRIKQHEGAAARLQQQLAHLEGLLIDPEWAPSVVVYYQLRGLGRRCESKLARFAEQLKQQREQKKHSSILVDWNEKRKEEARSVDLQILEKLDQIQMLEDQLQAEQRKLTSMSAFVRLFRGRSLMKLVDSLAAKVERAVEEEQALRDRAKDIRARKPPDQQGLDLQTKRSINLMILAFAQQLYIHFAEDGLAVQIKEATEKSVGAVRYGTSDECERLLDAIRRGVHGLEQSADFADVLRRRSRLLGEGAKYASDGDAVPFAGSVNTLFRINDDGVVHESEVDIAGQNYWGISRVFSR